MKKVVDLENRWKAYKYNNAIFYVFIAVFVAFVALLVFFIKMQVFDKPNSESAMDSAPKQIRDSASSAESTQNSTQKEQNKITFICRQVIVDKLTVRKEASFKSTALGYYPQDSIFCVSENKNGLVKTQNGWVSASDRYSQIVDVNMFADTGFYKYQNITQPKTTKMAKKSSVEEVRVFDKPINNASFAESRAESRTSFAESRAESAPKPAPAPTPKPKLTITSKPITKEEAIEFKKADFRNNKDYATAIEVARYYFGAKDYENSIKWALNASSADSRGKQKSESFIIYAKSLYLTGKQDQAFAVLDRYISATNSKDAIDTLNKLKQGII